MKRAFATTGLFLLLAGLAMAGCKPRLEGRIAFSSNRDGTAFSEIYVMNADGSNVVRLTHSEASDVCPSWSPDGSRIAFESFHNGNADIWMMDADGKNLVRLTDHPSADWAPDWSPDGEHIAFASKRDGNWEIYVMGADGSDVVRLTDNTTVDYYPDWSPDGTRIVFVCNFGGLDQICVMEADGSNAVRLTDGPWANCCPVWSPDGTRIAFASNLGTELAPHKSPLDIFVMNADGSNLERLTGLDHMHVQNYDPAWSPDGRYIVFSAVTDTSFEILVVELDGNHVVRLTSDEARDMCPAWSP